AGCGDCAQARTRAFHLPQCVERVGRRHLPRARRTVRPWLSRGRAALPRRGHTGERAPAAGGGAPRARLVRRARRLNRGDGIVPVYRGERESRACLESLLASANHQPLEVVVVDDASPEPAISRLLGELAAAGRITLVTHAANAGFVASVNEAMALHPD